MTVELITTVELPVFIKKKHELQNVSDKLNRLTIKALDVLEDSLTSDDKDAAYKAAKLVIELDIEAKKIISNDQMMRLIAEHKLKGPRIPLETNGEGGNKRLPPTTDFSRIQEVN